MEKLEVINLSHSFGFKQILKDINFRLEKAEVVSIVGPSGGGKTTLLHLCANLLLLEEGKIDNSFSSSAFAFQEARLLPWKNVLDNISLGLLAKKIKKEKALELAKEIALKFGLEEEDFYKFPKDLSGGMKQRVSFARALVVKPSLLFLDEPFSALDIGLKKELQTLLINTIEEEQLSILFITHDLMEAIKLSDEILLLKAEPVGHFVKSFKIKTPRAQRDEAFIYEQTARLLNDKYIINTFELELR
ncbi:ABC transporter ATP-binding protein [Halarcobacter bivalviorum]|uniref:ABC transporter ATP-binding protein n=1 Tax=Halarcobacter bivalviorum TaxID=663364 RepID=A0AAX2AA50_9BACT|nr:ATP-binding cassette domain-containing protein [Halarcobacter bivalviorum]AXH12029.1 nitrate/sulfonate/bicarbonate ABC transporter, ATP-binding protein [Halarcobacter bivalviorum]RXK11142.1 ABC transporter ATP-binding protein [Halarcobacter bivalviorum]